MKLKGDDRKYKSIERLKDRSRERPTGMIEERKKYEVMREVKKEKLKYILFISLILVYRIPHIRRCSGLRAYSRAPRSPVIDL